MICPHCNADLLYKERPGYRCSRCRKNFAFDPKLNPLRMHDIRLKKIIAKVSTEGTLAYTPAQLWYQSARKNVSEQKAGLSCITFTIIAAVIGTGFAIFINLEDLSNAVTCVAPIIIGAIIFLPFAYLLNIYFRKPWRYLKMPMSLDQFREKIINRWQQIYGDRPAGLIDSRTKRSNQPELDQLRGVLLCPQQDVLACLRANGVHRQLGLGLIPANTELTQAEQSITAELRSRPELPVYILHDASPSGVLMAEDIRKKLKRKVLDLGIHPRQAIEYKLMTLGAKPAIEELKGLEELHKSGQLSQEELEWLKKGFFSPILALTPNRVIRIITNAVERGSTTTAPQPPTPEEQAKAIGFMTWPAAS
jgi:DNA-directed RNA polymerase subunit RPC12/RpoP